MSLDAESSFRVEFVTRRRVEFADTDMGGVVHFARFFVFMENAEHLFLESLGSSAVLEGEEGNVLWPRVTASCEFLGPVHFRDELDIQLLVHRRGRTSLHYDAVFRLAGVEVARGQLTTVCCARNPEGRLEPRPIPEPIAAKVGPAPRVRSADAPTAPG